VAPIHLTAVAREYNMVWVKKEGERGVGADTGGLEWDTYCILLPDSTFGFAINSGFIAGENAVSYASIRGKNLGGGHGNVFFL
jgi:hypothetical protein